MENFLPSARLNGPGPDRLADLVSISHDLNSCLELINAILLQPQSHTNNLLNIFWENACVKYYRCFATGRRFKLNEKIFEEPKLIGSKEIHKKICTHRNQHIAHRVNTSQQVIISVVLQEESIEKRIIAVTKNIINLSLPLADEITAFKNLLENMLGLLENDIRSQEKIVLAWLESLPIEELYESVRKLT